MKKNLKEIIILTIQIFMFYIFPLFVGPTDIMEMVVLILLTTFILSLILGCISEHKIRYFYSLLISVLFLPTVFIYYNESALIHVIWYLVISIIGLIIGTVTKKVINKLKKINFKKYEKNSKQL